ncbi:hypothetical protein ABS767_09015 [Sphingomonas sp. ST-64]|uniref:TonB-dependent receptor n=1 Tax=Sphingomonas plantiphila TaxID=3163295 RepID=A0ABW8YPE0_9SPHN
MRVLMLGWCIVAVVPVCAQSRSGSPTKVSAEARAILLADRGTRSGSSVQSSGKTELTGEAARFELADLPSTRADFSLPALPTTPQAWRLAAPAFSTVRSEANATDRMALVGMTGPRHHRSTALDARLVLRIDGREESEPLSLGGGVARAIGTAMRN